MLKKWNFKWPKVIKTVFFKKILLFVSFKVLLFGCLSLFFLFLCFSLVCFAYFSLVPPFFSFFCIELICFLQRKEHKEYKERIKILKSKTQQQKNKILSIKLSTFLYEKKPSFRRKK